MTTTPQAPSTAGTPDLQERVSDFLFWPDIGDEFQLTKSGRLRMVVTVNLITDETATPVVLPPNKWSLSEVVMEQAHAWAELMDDPLVD